MLLPGPLLRLDTADLPTISMIRKALGDSRRDQKYIQTITKRGYRFVAATRLVPVPTVLGIVGRSIQESLKRAQLFRG